MRKWRPFRAIVPWAVAFLVTAGLGFESTSFGATVEERNRESGKSGPTAVAGESWLDHLHRSFDETSMGKTGQLGPPSPIPRAEFARWQAGLGAYPANETVILRGSDLYRMNCRGCHGPDGQGAPPEINSVINPVRATSAAAVMARMKTAGMDMSRADAAKLAQQSKGMLLDRLHHGGQDMPAFPHLRDAEVISLVAYLRQLAGVPGAEGEQLTIREPRVQVGEHIVKATCHICHSAAGPNPSPQQLSKGAIPPLNTLALRVSRAEFIRKVTHGAPVLMRTPGELFRGRMPVFYYLSETEAADAYLYLTRYPPYQWAVLDPMLMSAATQAVTQPDPSVPNPEPEVTRASYSANFGRAEVPTTGMDMKAAILAALVGFIAIALLGLGFGFTVCELRRLSARGEGRSQGADRIGEDAGAEDQGGEKADAQVDRERVA